MSIPEATREEFIELAQGIAAAGFAAVAIQMLEMADCADKRRIWFEVLAKWERRLKSADN